MHPSYPQKSRQGQISNNMYSNDLRVPINLKVKKVSQSHKHTHLLAVAPSTKNVIPGDQSGNLDGE